MRVYWKRLAAILTAGGVALVVAVQQAADDPATTEISEQLSCADAIRVAKSDEIERLAGREVTPEERRQMVSDSCDTERQAKGVPPSFRSAKLPSRAHFCRGGLLYGPGLGGETCVGDVCTPVPCPVVFDPGADTQLPHVVPAGVDPDNVADGSAFEQQTAEGR